MKKKKRAIIILSLLCAMMITTTTVAISDMNAQSTEVINSDSVEQTQPELESDFVIMHHVFKHIKGVADRDFYYSGNQGLRWYCQNDGQSPVVLKIYDPSKRCFFSVTIGPQQEWWSTYTTMPKGNYKITIENQDASPLNVRMLIDQDNAPLSKKESYSMVFESIFANSDGSQGSEFNYTGDKGFCWYGENNGTSPAGLTIVDKSTGNKIASVRIGVGETFSLPYINVPTGVYTVGINNQDGSKLNFLFRVNQFE